jgi:hypothetical protein
MMIQDNLVQYLSYALDNAFRKTLTPGEDILITLPGAMGEALAVTNRRIVVLRDKGSSEGVDVVSHQLRVVTGVKTGESPAGGTLEIETPVTSEDDRRTVYYGSFDKPKFEAAAQRINELIAAAGSDAGGPVVVETPGQESANIPSPKCATCGVQVNDRDIYCSACGTKLHDVCQICSAAMDFGTAFCPRCGSEAKPALTECPACDARANSTVMSYCPQCGTSLSPKCAACGGQIVPDWPRCRYCGREIGSEGIPGRGLRAQMDREISGRAKVSAAVKETEEVDEMAEEVESPAAKANARGTELFNEESIEEAIDEFRRAVTLDPNNASYHCNLAVAYGEADQEDDARREYERTLELNPKYITALLYLGYILNENDEAEQAAELWKRVIELAPGTPEAEEAQQNLGAQDNL